MGKTYSHNKGVLEQAFGLFSNLCLKMPAIAEHLTEKCELLSLAHITMHKHPDSPSLLRSVVQTVRNISKVEHVLESIKESVIIEELRDNFVKTSASETRRSTTNSIKRGASRRSTTGLIHGDGAPSNLISRDPCLYRSGDCPVGSSGAFVFSNLVRPFCSEAAEPAVAFFVLRCCSHAVFVTFSFEFRDAFQKK